MDSIRYAQKNDADGIIRLLKQVLEIHAAIRPDLFLSGTTKYTLGDVEKIISDPKRRTFVAVSEDGSVLGYALCIIKNTEKGGCLVPIKTLYIDDLCVDAGARKSGIGKKLFERAKEEARNLGCYDVTLNVWEGNDSARYFYDKMGMRIKSTQMEFIL